MSAKRNLIAHYDNGGSESVYLSCVRDNHDGTFSVIGKWGRQRKINQELVKATVRSTVAAEVEQKRLFNGKLSKGYIDIEGVHYHGTLTRNDSFIQEKLEPETASSSSVATRIRTPRQKRSEKAPIEEGILFDAASTIIEEQKQLEDDGVVICVNNLGMEEKFDKDVEYVAELHKDPLMLWVFDKFGKKAEYFKDRFVSLQQQKTLEVNTIKFRELKAGDKIKVINPQNGFTHYVQNGKVVSKPSH